MDWRWLQFLPSETLRAAALRIVQMQGARKFADVSAPLNMRSRVQGVGELIHPIGLAAGIDRDASCPHKLVNLGFSFLEIGTVTPKPQRMRGGKASGARMPKQFGVLDDRSYDNAGMEVVAARLQALSWPDEFLPLAVNIGKNQDTMEVGAAYDYLLGIRQFCDYAHFIVLNLSTLAEAKNEDLLHTIARETDTEIRDKLWIKLEPSLTREEFQRYIATAAELGFAGFILTNTRAAAPSWQSGHNLTTLATTYLDWAYEVLRGKLPIIASGGILTGSDVVQRIVRGANAVEIYTAFIYFGIGAVNKLLKETMQELAQLGYNSVEEARGSLWQ